MQVAVIPNANGLLELTLIELQGDLFVHHDLSGVEFGKLHWGPNDSAYLRIGHNQFEGKMVTLEKPLLLLDKKSKVFEIAEREGSKNQAVSGTIAVEGIIERKLLFKTRPRPIIATPGSAAPVKSVNMSNIFGKK
uniref:Transcription factor TFIIIC triple barrel domain-containing protein n=1 Tax=Panagrellus redivivus TaxID=6233 RepID=A0A7E4UMD8_PANRE